MTFTLRCCIWIRRKYISLAYGMKPLNERYFAIDMEFYSLSRLYGSGPRDHKTQWCETLSGTVGNKIQSFFITLFEQKNWDKLHQPNQVLLDCIFQWTEPIIKHFLFIESPLSSSVTVWLPLHLCRCFWYPTISTHMLEIK